MDASDIIEHANLEVQYTQLTQEIPIKAAELSAVHEEIKQAKDELVRIQELQEVSIKAISLEEIYQIEKDLHSSIKDLQSQEVELKGSIQALVDESTLTTIKLKQASKDLHRFNLQILQAQDEFGNLSKEIARLKTERESFAQMLTDIEKSKQLVTLLEGEKAKLLVEISTENNTWEGTLKQAREELAVLVHMGETKKKEAEQAQYRLKTYTDELYTHMNDYQIVKTRLEGVWKKTFPELDLPL